jgi:hypothetical protein
MQDRHLFKNQLFLPGAFCKFSSALLMQPTPPQKGIVFTGKWQQVLTGK